MDRKGLIFILSSPSGAGKTTVSKKILEEDEYIQPSISCTTRKPRTNENNGKDYFFITQQQFLEKIKNDEFIEYAEVFNNHYGTPKDFVESTLKKGIDILFDIDWQGTQQVHAKYPEDVVRVFILPPSIDILEKRLTERATDHSNIIQARMKEAISEMSHFAEYDYVVINENIQQTVKDVYNILCAERLKRHRQKGIVDFVNQMRFK